MNAIDKSFYVYLVYLIIGLALITLIPAQYRVLMVGILILGGFAAIGDNYPDLVNILSGKGSKVPIPHHNQGSNIPVYAT